MEEAEELFRRFLEGSEASLEWFISQARLAGFEVDLDVAPSADLVEWVAGEYEKNEPMHEPAPVWYGDADKARGMGARGASLIDGLIFLVASFTKRHTRADWTLKKSDRPLEVHNHQPVMRKTGAQPWEMARQAVARYRAGIAGPEHLGERLESLVSAAKTSPPDELEPRFGVSVSELLGDRGPDMAATLSEEIEYLLGEDGFEEMWRFFGEVQGVVELQWEDRESFLVTTDGTVSAREVEAAFQAFIDQRLN